MKITLIDKDGRLHLPSGEILICFYDEGDINTINSANPDTGDLFSALYGAREMGEIPSDTDTVCLPCGKEFDMSSLA